jgi:hypothetical protein
MRELKPLAQPKPQKVTVWTKQMKTARTKYLARKRLCFQSFSTLKPKGACVQACGRSIHVLGNGGLSP